MSLSIPSQLCWLHFLRFDRRTKSCYMSQASNQFRLTLSSIALCALSLIKFETRCYIKWNLSTVEWSQFHCLLFLSELAFRLKRKFLLLFYLFSFFAFQFALDDACNVSPYFLSPRSIFRILSTCWLFRKFSYRTCKKIFLSSNAESQYGPLNAHSSYTSYCSEDTRRVFARNEIADGSSNFLSRWRTCRIPHKRKAFSLSIIKVKIFIHECECGLEDVTQGNRTCYSWDIWRDGGSHGWWGYGYGGCRKWKRFCHIQSRSWRFLRRWAWFEGMMSSFL